MIALNSYFALFDANIANYLQKNNPWYLGYSLARTSMAVCLLVTLLFNGQEVILPTMQGVITNSTIEMDQFFYKINYFLLLSPQYFDVLRYFAVAFLIFDALGFYPKYSAIFHFYLVASYMNISSAIDGGDHLHNNLSLLILPICLFDPRKNHWQNNNFDISDYKKMIALSCLWAIRIQMAVVYFHAAVGKFFTEEWVNGTAVYYWLNSTLFSPLSFLRPFFDVVLSSPFFVMLMSWGTLFFELSLFLCLVLPRKNRPIFLILAIFFHLSILFMHGLVSFFFSISAGLILYLLPYDFSFKNHAYLRLL